MPFRFLALFLGLSLACNQTEFSGSSNVREDTPWLSHAQEFEATSEKTERQVFEGARVIDLVQGEQDVTEEFQQGQPEDHHESFAIATLGGADEFTQITPPKPLDILVVVDNSPSMEEEQINLSTKLEPLLSAVEGSDWRIGVTTTDPEDGCLTALIRKSDGDASSKFKDAVTAGIKGSGIERGISQAIRGLDASCQDWVRPDSVVSVLFVSDEDHCSNGYKCSPTEPYRKAQHMIDFLAGKRTIGEDAMAFGLIWHPSQTQDECKTGLHKGNHYADVIRETSGSWGSICSADYTDTLKKFSREMRHLLSSFSLSQKPIAETLKVMVNGVEVTDGYLISEQTISFAVPPEPSSSIKVDYQYFAESEQKFTLSNLAEIGTMAVKVGDEPLMDQQFSYDPTTRLLTLNELFFGSEVHVSYQTPAELKASWPISGQPKDGISVTMNGDVLAPEQYQFDSQNHVLNFVSAPPQGAQIQVSFKQIEEPQVSYPHGFVDADEGELEVTNLETGESIPFEILGEAIVFNPDHVINGRKVRMLPIHPIAQIEALGQIVDKNEIIVRQGDQVCPAEKISYDNSTRRLDLTSCEFSMETTFELQYQWVEEHRKEFEVKPEVDHAIRRLQWTVEINGEQTEDFSIETTEDVHKVIIEDLPLRAKVNVALRFKKSN